MLALTFLATLAYSTTAASDVLQGDIYLEDSVRQIQNYTSLTAGQSYVANFQVNAQASNATMGNVMGFCMVLRDVGPAQCQYTIQLASGTVQVCCGRPKTLYPGQYCAGLSLISQDQSFLQLPRNSSSRRRLDPPVYHWLKLSCVHDSAPEIMYLILAAPRILPYTPI